MEYAILKAEDWPLMLLQFKSKRKVQNKDLFSLSNPQIVFSSDSGKSLFLLDKKTSKLIDKAGKEVLFPKDCIFDAEDGSHALEIYSQVAYKEAIKIGKRIEAESEVFRKEMEEIKQKRLAEAEKAKKNWAIPSKSETVQEPVKRGRGRPRKEGPK